nr:hypothetical protein BaRGS_003521 [Batillaria attramentaria]
MDVMENCYGDDIDMEQMNRAKETLTGEKTSVDQFCQNYPKECWLNQIINKHQGYNRLFPAKIFAWAVGGG